MRIEGVDEKKYPGVNNLVGRAVKRDRDKWVVEVKGEEKPLIVSARFCNRIGGDEWNVVTNLNGLLYNLPVRTSRETFSSQEILTEKFF